MSMTQPAAAGAVYATQSHKHNGFNQSLQGAPTYPPPYFVQALTGLLYADEGEPIQLETCVEPAGDNSLQVDWYKDGQLLTAGSRFNTTLDRGYVSLEILYTFPEDSGQYICVVSSASGQVQSNEAVVSINAEADVLTGTNLPEQETLNKLHSLDQQGGMHNGGAWQREDKNIPKSPPEFTRFLPERLEVREGEPVHLELRVTPVQDATLTIDWLKNSTSISTGSRSNIILDRGFCILDFAYCNAEDAGCYVCVATNALGSVSSNQLHLNVITSERIVTTSSLPESSIASIRQLEEFGEEHASYREPDQVPVPPTLIAPLDPPSLQVDEGEPVFWAARVDCGSGQKVTAVWLKDGEVVQTGSRVSGQIELGVVTLLIRHAYAEDSGEYWCTVASECGQVETNRVILQCQADATIQSKPLTKGMAAIQQLEDDLNKLPEAIHEEEECADLPSVVKPLEDLPELDEGQPVHLDLRVEPAHDNSLSVEWYKDNAQLSTGSRFHFVFERGYASLDILYTISEDSGEYCCVVKNRNGTTESNRVKIQCIRGAGVVTDSNLAEGSAGYLRIKEMEEESYRTDDNDFRYREEEEEVPSPPEFQILPGPMYSYEGGPAKFLVRISGYPRAAVIWYINDEPIVEDSNHYVYNDGAINCLEIHRCQILGESVVRVVATNDIGSKQATAALNVVAMEDFRPDLKHIRPDNPYKKLMSLKKVDVSPELDNKLKKAKPSIETIQMIERESHMRHRLYKCNDVMETEQLYDKVAAGLKKFDASSHSYVNKQQQQHQQHQAPQAPQRKSSQHQSAEFSLQL